MERLKCDPLEALLRIVKNRRLSIALRMDAAKAAAPYCYPRLSTVFMAGKVDSDVNITGFLAAAQHDPELSAAMEKLSLAMCADRRERKADDVDGTPNLHHSRYRHQNRPRRNRRETITTPDARRASNAQSSFSPFAFLRQSPRGSNRPFASSATFHGRKPR